ncbi:hypothetical protein, partial [Proteus terrae]|uniref:hypothetical protein n=1 Tax=Proteus terrae TaxID=1574161 RepID=UPI0034E42F21
MTRSLGLSLSESITFEMSSTLWIRDRKVFGDEALLNKENMKGTDYSVKKYLESYQQLVIELKVLEKKLNENKDISGSINTISNEYKYLIENYNSLIAK